MQGPKSNIDHQSTVMEVQENFFVCADDDSTEVLLHCKQVKCKGIWFVDKSEGRTTYPCPVCETYNCFKCQVIHDNKKCEEGDEYDKHVPDEATWKCEFCEYSDNQMDTAICVICSRTNDKIIMIGKYSATEHYRLLELEESNTFIPSIEKFECSICTDVIQPDNGVQLRGCLHNFCFFCIRTYIEKYDQPEIECPFFECTNILEDREIQSLVLPQVYAHYLEISLRIGKTQIQNGYQCCVTNCQGWWIYTDGIYDYNCPVCQTLNCISCKASHSGIDCKTYQERLFYSTENGIKTRQRLEEMLEVGDAEHCPKCNVIVVKYGGCAHMVCTMCQTKFDWGQNANKNFNIT